jgi:hypothetical protein
MTQCAHCRKQLHKSPLPHDYYVVKQELWDEYGVGNDMLCFHCFEAMLGRSLTPDDILFCPASMPALAFVYDRIAAAHLSDERAQMAEQLFSNHVAWHHLGRDPDRVMMAFMNCCRHGDNVMEFSNDRRGEDEK